MWIPKFIQKWREKRRYHDIKAIAKTVEPIGLDPDNLTTGLEFVGEIEISDSTPPMPPEMAPRSFKKLMLPRGPVEVPEDISIRLPACIKREPMSVLYRRN